MFNFGVIESKVIKAGRSLVPLIKLTELKLVLGLKKEYECMEDHEEKGIYIYLVNKQSELEKDIGKLKE